jgi:cytochrome c553
MSLKQLTTASLLAVSALFLTACGDDIIVQADFAGEALAVIPFDNQKAEEGADNYFIFCARCHGIDGLATINFATMILPRVYGSQSAVDENKLAYRSFETMPPEDKIACDFVCQDTIQHYFYRFWSEENTQSSSSATASSEVSGSSSSAPVGPTQEEIDARIAAGKLLYDDTTNICGFCHGSDGNTPTLAPRPLSDFGGSYNAMLVIIRDGVSGTLMPACRPIGNCAPQITDYVWADLLGFTLTESGGTRP